MGIKLYRYQFGDREGFVLQNGSGWGEIAPLPNFSKETLQEAEKEVIDHFYHGKPPTLPSVLWGLACAAKPYDHSPFSIPLCAFKKPFPGSAYLKLKLKGLSLEESISIVSSYIGKYHLRIDCNRAWSLSQAMAFAKNFSPLDFDYLEEPLQNFEDLITFSQWTKFPIAVDESYRDNLPTHKIPTLKAIVVKPMLSGKIFPLFPKVVLSSSYETSLGILQIARNGASDVHHGLHTFVDDLLSPPLKAENGYLIASEHTIDTQKLCLIHSLA